MLKQIRQSTLIKSIGVYGLGNIFGAAVPFLLIPFLTRTLTQEDYGLVAMFTVLTAVAYPFCGLNLHEFLQIRFFKTNSQQFHQMKKTAIKLALSATAIVGVLFLALCGPIEQITEFPINWLGLVVITAAGRVFCEMILSIWQVEDRPFNFIFFQGSQTILNLAVTLLLVAVIPLAWKGRVIAQACAAVGGAIVALFFLLKYVEKPDNAPAEPSAGPLHKEMLGFGVLLVPHAISSVVMDMSDRLILTHMKGLAVTGVYSVGYQVSLIIMLVGFSMHKAWTPWLFTLLKQNSSSARQKIRKGIAAYAGVLVVTIAALSVGSQLFLPFFLGEQFEGAIQYVFWIALGFGLNGLCNAILSVALFKDQVKPLSVVSFFVALAHVLITFLFISEFGAIGAAYSLTTAYALKLLGVAAVVLKSGGLNTSPKA